MITEDEVIEMLDGIRDLIEAGKTGDALKRIDAIAEELEDDIEEDEAEPDEDEDEGAEEIPEQEEESLWR